MTSSQQVLRAPIAGVELQCGYCPPNIYRTRWFCPTDFKSGKTNTLASVPDCVTCDAEGKMCLVPGVKGHYWTPKYIDEVTQMVNWVASGKSPFRFFGFDTVDELVSGLIIPELTADVKRLHSQFDGYDVTEWKSSVKGSGGWAMVSGTFIGWIRTLNRAGIGWWVNGHIKSSTKTMMIGGKEQDVVTTRPAVNPGVYGALYRAAEFIVAPRMAIRTEVKKTPRLDDDGNPMPLLNPATKEPFKEADGSIRYITQTTKEIVRECILRVIMEKEADSMNELGTNVKLPDGMTLPITDAWEQVIRPAYEKATT